MTTLLFMTRNQPYTPTNKLNFLGNGAHLQAAKWMENTHIRLYQPSQGPDKHP